MPVILPPAGFSPSGEKVNREVHILDPSCGCCGVTLGKD